MLFPTIGVTPANTRSAEFWRRRKLLGIRGVSLHSHRYGWAERAKSSGYPERYAQEALAHKSRAVRRAYARQAHVILPALETYEDAPPGKPALGATDHGCFRVGLPAA